MSINESPESTAEVLGFLRAAGRAGLSASELSTELGPGSTGRELEAVLARLATEGRVVSWSKRWYALEGSRWRVGRLQRRSARESIVWSDPVGDRRGREYRIAEKDRNGARSGDRVLLRPLARSGSRERRPRSTGAPSATVVRILERARKRLVGRLERDGSGWRLWSWARGLAVDAQELSIESAPDLEPGLYVVAEWLESAPEPSQRTRGRGRTGKDKDRESRAPLARVVERLGHLDEAGTDIRVVLRHYEIPEELEERAQKEAAELEPYRHRPGSKRVDLRQRLAVTVDGEDARDFDDAISIESQGQGQNQRYRVSVHIADVAHYLKPGSALDREAYRRGTSVYFPERAVHMLPSRLSEDLCSLREGEDRPTMTVEMTIAASGERTAVKVFESVIQSRARLTYQQVQALFDRDQQAEPPAGMSQEVAELLTAGRKVAGLLRKRRERSGAVDFDLPLPELSLDERGGLLEYRDGRRLEANRLIEELMIAANRSVAERASEAAPKGANAPARHALFRVHPTPDESDLEPVATIARGLGLLDSESPLEANELSSLLARAQAAGEGELISRLVLRSMGKAVYSADCSPHFALAANAYCHFTSPIRRYPDLMVHRQMKQSVAGEIPDAAEAGSHLSRLERRAESAERDLREWKKLRYLADRAGDEYDGTITGVADFGVFVVLRGLAVDGLAPLEYFDDDEYRLEQEHHRLVGARSGRQLRLGDQVRATIYRVDLPRRRLVLTLAGAQEADKPKQSRPKQGRPKQSRPKSQDARRARRPRGRPRKGS